MDRTESQPQLGPNVPRRGNRFTRAFAQTILRLFGWRIVGEVPDLPKFVLIGAPHTSNYDFFLTEFAAVALGVDLHFLMKHTVFAGPLDALLRRLGGISVDRSQTKDFVQQSVAEFDRRESFLLAITPEGTRTQVPEWRSGFYYIALGAEVPIVLVKFDYGNKAVRLGPTFYPTGDYETDLIALKALYAGVRGRRGKMVEQPTAVAGPKT